VNEDSDADVDDMPIIDNADADVDNSVRHAHQSQASLPSEATEDVREDILEREKVASAAIKPQRKPAAQKAKRATTGNILVNVLFDAVTSSCRLCGVKLDGRSDNFPRHFVAKTNSYAELHQQLHDAAERAPADESLDAACSRVAALLVERGPKSGKVQRSLNAYSRPTSVVDASDAEKLLMKPVERELATILFFANNNIALSIADSVEFQGLMEALGHRAWSSQTLRNREHEFMTHNRENFKTSQSMRVVNFTTDYWKEIGTPFIGVTVHWVDASWVLHEQLLALIDTRDWSAQSEISQAMVETLIHARLRNDVTCFVATADNANSARRLAHLLSGDVEEKKGWGCCCHLLNLVVKQDVFESDTVSVAAVNDIFDRWRNLVAFFHRRDLVGALRDAQIAAGVSQQYVQVPQRDNDTRWHGLERMARSIGALTPYIQGMVDEGRINIDAGAELPSVGDRKMLSDLVLVLEKVHVASSVLERSHSPTMSLVSAALTILLFELDTFVQTRSVCGEVVAIAQQLVNAIHRRFSAAMMGVSWANVAAALSPNFADLHHVSSNRSVLFDGILDLIVSESMYVSPPVTCNVDGELAFADDDLVAPPPNGGMVYDSSVVVGAERKELARQGLVVLKRVAQARLAATKCAVGTVGVVKWVQFAKEHLDGNEDIEFWQAVCEKKREVLGSNDHGGCWECIQKFYEVFHDTVRAILSIQASSAACERAFSEAGWLLSGRPGLSIAALEEMIRQRKSVRSEHASLDAYRHFIAKNALDIVRSRQ